MLLERLKVTGIETSEHYVPGGYYNTSPAGSSVQMPNCTMYSMLRAWEALDDKIKGIAIKNSYGFHNAKNWYEETGLEKGTEIRDFSIAVFDGNCGHVAFVERKIDATHAVITESNYDDNKKRRDYKYFNCHTVELVVGKATLSGIGKLKGFIYLPIANYDVRTCRNTSKEQVQINENMVNVRTGAGTCNAIAVPGCYCPKGIYNVLDKKTVDGCVWYELDEDCWVCHGEWLTHYDKESSKDLKEQNEALKAALTKIREIADKALC